MIIADIVGRYADGAADRSSAGALLNIRFFCEQKP